MIGAESRREKQIAVPRLRKSIRRVYRHAGEENSPNIDAEIGDSVRGSPACREKEDLLTLACQALADHLAHAHRRPA